MTVVLRPTRAYEQRDKLVTLQWSGLWDVISLQTLCWERGDKKRSWNKNVNAVRIIGDIYHGLSSEGVARDRVVDPRETGARCRSEARQMMCDSSSHRLMLSSHRQQAAMQVGIYVTCRRKKKPFKVLHSPFERLDLPANKEDFCQTIEHFRLDQFMTRHQRN